MYIPQILQEKKEKKYKFDKMGIQKRRRSIQTKINQCETMNIPQI